MSTLLAEIIAKRINIIVGLISKLRMRMSCSREIFIIVITIILIILIIILLLLLPILKKGGGRMSSGCSQKLQKRVGDACPQGALKNCKKTGGGRMSSGCSQTSQKKRWGTHVLRVLSNQTSQKIGIHFQFGDVWYNAYSDRTEGSLVCTTIHTVVYYVMSEYLLNSGRIRRLSFDGLSVLLNVMIELGHRIVDGEINKKFAGL
jgi:hypothetical protein